MMSVGTNPCNATTSRTTTTTEAGDGLVTGRRDRWATRLRAAPVSVTSSPEGSAPQPAALRRRHHRTRDWRTYRCLFHRHPTAPETPSTLVPGKGQPCA